MIGVVGICVIGGALVAATVLPAAIDGMAQMETSKNEANADKAKTASDERVALAEIEAEQKQNAAIAQASRELDEYNKGLGYDQGPRGGGRGPIG